MMPPRKSPRRTGLAGLVLLALLCDRPAAVRSADWPTWRHDAMRSGATSHALPRDLKRLWQRDLGKPDPAFDYHFRLCADPSYEPVAAGGLVFVPSNTTDGVTAYDLEGGLEKWHFLTEGPVRFAPVVGGDTVYLGSDDGHVYAVNAATGRLRWKSRGAPPDRPDYRMLVNDRLCSRWPVRGGPVLQDGVLYFGCGLWPSEGVFLVALDAATGAVLWRNADIAQIADGLEEHGKMADLGLPPHGYLAMIAGKVAMPSGRALAAFADPRTGRLDPYNSYYAKVYPVPRGSWALCGNADFWFQGGAIMGTHAAALDSLPLGPLSVEAFAQLAGKPMAWAEDMIRRELVTVRHIDGRRSVMIDPRSPQLALNIKARDVSTAQLFQLAERPVLNMSLVGTRHEVGERGMPVFTDKLMFRSEFRDPKGIEVERGMTRVAVPKYDVLRAYRLDGATWRLEVMPSKKFAGAQRHLDFPVAWELPVRDLTVKLLAGDRLFLAGQNKIVAVALPAGSGDPRIVWEARVAGFPVGVIAAQDHLIVTTDAGRLYAFGTGESRDIVVAQPDAWERQPAWRGQVAKLRDALPSGGNALVLGWNSGELAKELALQSWLRVIVAEPDAGRAEKARADLLNAGAWARRIHIVAGASNTLKLPPYFAEIVLSENLAGLDDGARAWTRMALDALRPHSGVAVLPLRPKLLEQARAHAESVGGYTFSADQRLSVIRRVAAPKGADDWTHESATAGNTFASHDTLAIPPFGLLWYSGSIDREFSPPFEFHHNRNPYPTIAAGRIFMLAGNAVHAADAYTGRHLWKTAVPESAKTGRRLSDHRTFSRPTDQNLIATAERLYVFQENSAHTFDPATGSAMNIIELPKEFGEAAWDEARIAGGTLYIGAGGNFVALDRFSGAMKWRHAADGEHVAFALGGGRVFAVDYSSARGRDPAQAGGFETRISELDAASGAAAWSETLEAGNRPGQSEASAGKPKWSGIFQDNPLKPTLHYNAAHNIVLAIVDRYQFFAFDAQSGSPLWRYSAGARLTDLVTFEPPTVTSDLVILDDGTELDVRSGKPASPNSIGARGGTGCNRFVGSDALLTFRSALACVVNLASNERTYLSSTRPGCTNSMIPAAGLLNAPNYAHGCVCNYPFLASFSLFHLPEAAPWGPKTRPKVQVQKNPNAD
jgi:outer membrane protein assembly factor BamB